MRRIFNLQRAWFSLNTRAYSIESKVKHGWERLPQLDDSYDLESGSLCECLNTSDFEIEIKTTQERNNSVLGP